MAENTQQDSAAGNGGDTKISVRTSLQNMFTKLFSDLFSVVVGGIAIVFIVLFGVAIWQSERVIRPLAEPQVARGLITFLVAIVTVTIALIMTLYAVLSSASNEQEKRFNHAKEVLTILIGVLGTVIGFYFGSANDNQAGALNASETVVNNPQPSNGETLMMTNLVTGGRPPYIYAVTFDPVNVVSNAITGTSRDGMIQQSIPISASIETATDVTMQVSVWDSSGQMATVNGTKLLVSP